MKGFVPTPTATVDLMVERLFKGRPPHKESRVLDPGCGHGVFIEGVLRWCGRQNVPRPFIVGIGRAGSGGSRGRAIRSMVRRRRWSQRR